MDLLSRYGIAFAHITSACVIAIGFVTLGNHMGEGEPMGWFGSHAVMAPETAISVILIGASLFTIASLVDRHIRNAPKNNQRLSAP